MAHSLNRYTHSSELIEHLSVSANLPETNDVEVSLKRETVLI